MPSGNSSSPRPFLHSSMVLFRVSNSSLVPRTITQPHWPKNQVTTGLISNSSFLPKTTIRLPQKRAMAMNTGSMAEIWVGARMKPGVWIFFRFSFPITWMRNRTCQTSHAAERMTGYSITHTPHALG